MDSPTLPSIDLELVHKLTNDPNYREQFFLAEASAEIARQLIKLRKRRELSQTELAERAGTQQPAVSRAEQADYQNWSFNTLRKLTNAMGGRLRVVIDAWEDVLHEYHSDGDAEDAGVPPDPEFQLGNIDRNSTKGSLSERYENPHPSNDNFDSLGGGAASKASPRSYLA